MKSPPSRMVVALVCLMSALIARPIRAGAESVGAFNDWAHKFNRSFVDGAVKPVVDGVGQLHEPVRTSLGNAFSNLSEPVSALSHLMVGDAASASESTARFTVNSTVGVLGMFDVATPMGLPRNKRHFSEGVCALGLATRDSYVVVPAVGPSTMGIAGTAVFVMVGSTIALSYVSAELAVASVMADVAGSAAALESAASSSGQVTDGAADRESFYKYLSRIGC